MTILVLNSGSSSLKFKLYDAAGEVRDPLAAGAVVDLGERAQWTWRAGGRIEDGYDRLGDHGQAAAWVLEQLRARRNPPVTAVGHRVVHGGEEFRAPLRLTPAATARLEALSSAAPLHNPPALKAIHACRTALGEAVPMIAVFDTAFHATLPEAAWRYALPEAWVRAHRIRRYGFHGIAHRYMYERYLTLSGKPRARVVAFQLGHGCSAAAIRDGRSLDTSMGYTPLEGLIMSTRCGDVDPGALVRVAAGGARPGEIEDALNRASGLLALSGRSADMRTLLAEAARGEARAQLAVEAFCHRARKYLGAYLSVLGGADAILFGGGIGEHAPEVRARICADMSWCGVRLDPRANAETVGTEGRISAAGAGPAVYVVPVDEEVIIARDVRAVLAV